MVAGVEYILTLVSMSSRKVNINTSFKITSFLKLHFFKYMIPQYIISSVASV